MANRSSEVQNGESYPVSALLMSIWFVLISCFGIPLNLFIIVSTLSSAGIRAVGSNIFIGSLALADLSLLVNFSLHLPYVLSSNESLCKIVGAGLGVFGFISVLIPPFLAINRYSIVCSPQNRIAQLIRPAFSRKGIYIIIGLIGLYQFTFNLPFVIFDTLGLQSLGLCGAVNMNSRNQTALRIYYLGGYVGVLFASYIPMFIFYTKIAAWVNAMSAALVLSVETRESLVETKNLMKLTKWITIVPLILTSPLGVAALLLEIDPHMIPVRLCRICVCFFSMSPVFNAVITVTLARPYRMLLWRLARKTRMTSILFFWLNVKNISPIDVTVPRSAL